MYKEDVMRWYVHMETWKHLARQTPHSEAALEGERCIASA